MRFSNLEHRQVGSLIGADHSRLEVPVIQQCHRNLARIFDDVAIGDDVAVLSIHDYARTRALELPDSHLTALWHVKESTKVRVFAQWIARHPLGQRAAGCNVYHRG